jgi:hypothetical protein
MKRSLLLLVVGTAFALPVLAADDAAAPRPGVVRQIEVVVTRVDPSVIRRELAFKEGDEFTSRKVEESRKNLLKLGLLKSLEIEETWDDALDGYKVTVKADDGWFILPLPMFGSRGGESFAALMVMEQNYFCRSEGIMAAGFYAEGRYGGMASLFLPHVAFMGGVQESVIDEYQYADGGYNSKRFDEDSEDEEPGDFGTVTNHYEKSARKTSFSAGGRVAPWLRLSAGLSLASVSYDDPEFSVPPDEGDYNAWNVSLNVGREGRGDPALQGGFVGAFGRIFGLGMAGVKEGLKPLPSTETTHHAGLSLERGESWLGSDADYTKGMLSASQVTIFRDRSALAISLKGGRGDDLPPSQLLSTGQRGLLAGVYAREYRGEALAAGTASFSQPFFRTVVGMLNAEVFFDYAACWADEERREKQGAGLNFAYRFWRFPLPLGTGATYSFDDENWQLSFAVGGMF